jgi:hypothetical protein
VGYSRRAKPARRLFQGLERTLSSIPVSRAVKFLPRIPKEFRDHSLRACRLRGPRREAEGYAVKPKPEMVPVQPRNRGLAKA